MKDKNEIDKRIRIPSPKQLLRHKQRAEHKERAEEKINVAADAEQHISY